MTNLMLTVAVAVLAVIVLVQFLLQRRINKDYNRLLNSIVQTIQAQKAINDSQLDINDNLGQNIEILGVHTKLIPPSISMQAEAFLAWHNKRKEDRGNGEV